MVSFEKLNKELVNLILDGDRNAVLARVRQLLDEGMSPLDFFTKCLTPVMSAIGDKFAELEIFLPELIMAGEIAKAISEEVLSPALKAGEAMPRQGTVVIGTVQGDLHDIGKNMVALMLEVNGFDVVDLGTDVPVKKFLEKSKEVQADIIGLSSLMTTSMPYMKEVVEMRDGFGLKDRFAIIVGGAPITPEYARQIGADAYALDAVEGVQKCQELVRARAA